MWRPCYEPDKPSPVKELVCNLRCRTDTQSQRSTAEVWSKCQQPLGCHGPLLLVAIIPMDGMVYMFFVFCFLFLYQENINGSKSVP